MTGEGWEFSVLGTPILRWFVPHQLEQLTPFVPFWQDLYDEIQSSPCLCF